MFKKHYALAFAAISVITAANDKTAVWYWGRRHTTTATVRRGPLNVVTLTKNGSKAG